MNIKNKLKKIINQLSSKDNYTKYDDYGDLHWRWDGRGGWYTELVDDSLTPFKDIELGTVLDVGSGDGLVSDLLSQKGFTVEGVEPTETGAEISKQKNKNIKIHQATIEKFLSQNTKQYDYVYSLNTIEYVKNYYAFVDLMSFVKNFAVIVTDNADMSDGDELHHEKEFTIEELEELFSEYKTERLSLRDKTFIGIKVYAK